MMQNPEGAKPPTPNNFAKRIVAGVTAALAIGVGIGYVQSGTADKINANLPQVIDGAVVLVGLIGTIWHPKPPKGDA